MLTPQQRRQFSKDPTVNPLTGRKITVGKSVHRSLVKACMPKKKKRGGAPTSRETNVLHFVHRGYTYIAIYLDDNEYVIVSTMDGKERFDAARLDPGETIQDWVSSIFGEDTRVKPMSSYDTTLRYMWCRLNERNDREAGKSSKILKPVVANSDDMEFVLRRAAKDRIFELLDGDVPKCPNATRGKTPKKALTFATPISKSKVFEPNTTDPSIFWIYHEDRVRLQDEPRSAPRRIRVAWLGVSLPNGNNVLVPPKDIHVYPIIYAKYPPAGFGSRKLLRSSEWWMVKEAISVLENVIKTYDTNVYSSFGQKDLNAALAYLKSKFPNDFPSELEAR